MNKQIYNSDITNTIISNIVILNIPQYINLCIDNINNDCLISNNNIKCGFILPISGYNFGDFCIYNKFNYDMTLKVDNKQISQLDISLYDDNNLIFDNNNADYCVLIEYN